MKEAGGLIFPGRLIDVGKHVTFDVTLDFFRNTYKTAIGTNPSSTIQKGNTLLAEKPIVFQRPTRTQSDGSHSTYCHLHPLLSQMTDLAKDKGDIEFANEMMHKIIGGLLKRHKNSKNNENEQANDSEQIATPTNARKELSRGELLSIVNISTEFHPGIIVTTGAVDNMKEHKRAAPRGSPSNYKKDMAKNNQP